MERHLADLERQKDPAFAFEFSEKQATRALNFFSSLRHTKGALGGKPFNLQDNQAFILACLFGWRRKSGGRRFTQAYIEEARKGGKSELAAGIEIYTGFFEGEEGAEVYTAATTRDQAGMVFQAVKKMCKFLRSDSKKLASDIRIGSQTVNYYPTDSRIQKVSADADTLDGLSPHCAVVDEYHAHKNDLVKGAMQTGQGERRSPLLLIITTAGFQKEYPCYKVERANAVSVLKGERRQENLFAIIFTQDEGEIEAIMSLDPEHPEQAREILRLAKKSNPNLGSTPTESYILEQVKDAQNKGSSTRVQVLTKNFNCWLDAPKVWIPEEQLKAVMRPIDLSEFHGRLVFLGLDLAATTDLTSLCIFSPGDDGQPAISKNLFWLPEDTVRKRNEIAPYADWVEQGHILTTPGNIVDYGAVKRVIYELQENCQIYGVGYDEWNAWETTAELAGNGLNMQKVLPRFGWQSNPTKRIEMMVLAKDIEMDSNPVLLWNFRNIALDYDSQDNVKPNKQKSAEKIDGVAAMVDAVFVWLQYLGNPQTGSYLFDEETELITV